MTLVIAFILGGSGFYTENGLGDWVCPGHTTTAQEMVCHYETHRRCGLSLCGRHLFVVLRGWFKNTARTGGNGSGLE